MSHIRAVIIAAAAGLLLTLGACSDSTGTAPDTAKTAPATPEAEPDPAEDTADEAVAAETAQLPDLTGETLQAAQDAAQAAGFYGLTSSDATGASRMQLLDRNWQVCAQAPAAGSHPTDTVVDFSTVKIEESCP
ncbi:hypothetical protein [Streptomyces sp. NPDC059209]|uniref:hypothetical protein n=1 Tax=Streptomyces sp. NPDC059209 TaxID=3346769 RepID=UPI0036B85274